MAQHGVLITGGGTGGHMYPLIAVAKKLPDTVEVRYFGSPGQFADDLKEHQIRITKIMSSKLRRYFSFKNFFDVFKFVLGFLQALVKVFFFMPDVAFSKGGPGALPVLLACRFYRIPVVIHETDSVPGRTNTISARFATLVELGYAEAEERFKKIKGKVNVVGNPIRDEILQGHDPKAARELFGLPADDLPTIFVLGGSQGAKSINDFVLTNIEEFLNRFHIIHQIGPEKFDEYKNSYELLSRNFSPVLKKRYRYFAFLGANMTDALDAADIVVSRAGGSIFEIAAKGKPSILVPLGVDVVGEHQMRNAYIYSKTGAAVLTEEENLLRSVFINQVESLLKDQERLKKMQEAARAFAKPDAAQNIADDIMSLVSSTQ